MTADCMGRDSPDYPRNVELWLGEQAPATVCAAGEIGALAHRTIALFCSTRCPGRLIDRTYDLAQRLRRQGRAVVGGFHGPMEREALRILLRSPHPLVVCPARGLGRMRVPAEWRDAFDGGRLLVLSCFAPDVHRATSALAMRRNDFVAALADEILIAHAAEGSKLQAFATGLLAWGKPVHTLADPANDALVAAGARVFDL